MFNRTLTSALFAGAAAGLIAALLQLLFLQPVLLHAELYESGKLVHFGGQLNSASPALPLFDPMRDLLSIGFTMAIYVGYAFISVALISLADEEHISPRKGVIWGLAGFIALHLAPAFSLPPEVPGVASADVEPRQIWWFATAIAAVIGLWMIAFSNSVLMVVVGILLLLVPHIIGAPQPEHFVGPVPAEIAALFSARALGIGLAAWVTLGVLSCYFWKTEGAHVDA